MRGHEKIIWLRYQGLKPRIVFLNDYPCRTDWFETGSLPDVCTAGDPLSSLDLRFLKGLVVSITSESLQRTKDLFEKAKVAGATSVAAGHAWSGMKASEYGTGWSEVFHG